jgi:PRTRC genetic system protein C
VAALDSGRGQFSAAATTPPKKPWNREYIKDARSRSFSVTFEWSTTLPESVIWRNKLATTTLKASTLPREFVFNGARIPDPDPQMNIDQVRDLLTPSYPEIATATMTGPEDTGTSLRYSFSRAIGSKG